ncbi:alpha-L-fucosidase [Muricomes intestini]|uniref:alpha-L-fucosidase n=2 Tax=Muricomes intestini TaxID=1796634 RepID=A0A4R3KH98_9FIRM|nr:alpha-L-fucosidase [Muricomes intestini]TCS82399.1 alpha-L-fucosidase [Muricomes intestini]
MDINYAVSIKPSERQLAWQKMEFYGFIHFGMNTMTDREWGLGYEDLSLFNPQHLDCRQWVQAMKAAGMRGAILTCKHHDGFCLWPSKYSKHTVAQTPWQNGHGDVVKEMSEACCEEGLKFGIYLSPWDRTEASYGEGKAYDDFYVRQLEELLTGYGDIFEVWFDGANGEGADGKKQVYDWERYYDTIRKHQPEAVIAVCGPDVRWIGNEAGQTRAEEWSVVPSALRDVEKVAEKSQKVDDGKFSRKLTSGEENLGSREVLAEYEGELVWYPAEVNTSIRPGWFYHQNEDSKVRTGDELFELYCCSVGGNGTFLLNLPPTPEGMIAPEDIRELELLGNRLKNLRSNDEVIAAEVEFSSGRTDKAALDDEKDIYWQPTADDNRPQITLHWRKPVSCNIIILKEYIADSQRIEKCQIYYRTDGRRKMLVECGTIGYKRILRFDRVETGEITITFPEYRIYPTISGVQVINEE